MEYVKAKNILPAELIEKIQEYAAGTYLYIPQKKDGRKSWGERKNSREWYSERNRRIYGHYKSGFPVSEISQKFFLSEKSIYRIILQAKKQMN